MSTSFITALGQGCYCSWSSSCLECLGAAVLYQHNASRLANLFHWEKKK